MRNKEEINECSVCHALYYRLNHHDKGKLCGDCKQDLEEERYMSEFTDPFAMRVKLPIKHGFDLDSDIVVCPTGERYAIALDENGNHDVQIVDGSIEAISRFIWFDLACA